MLKTELEPDQRDRRVPQNEIKTRMNRFNSDKIEVAHLVTRSIGSYATFMMIM